MESREHTSERQIPRPSRLPLPRAALKPSTGDISQSNSSRLSQIPRPSDARSLRIKDGVAISSSAETCPTVHEIQENAESSRTKSPTIKPAQHSHLTFANTQANTSEAARTSGMDTEVTGRLTTGGERRKPRPSLSERTMETLSLIPPSPSPSRRRPSMSSTNGYHSTPIKPPSYLRSPGSNIDIKDRATSPSKQSFGTSQFVAPPARRAQSSLGVHTSGISARSTVATVSAKSTVTQRRPHTNTTATASNPKVLGGRTAIASSHKDNSKLLTTHKEQAAENLARRPIGTSTTKFPLGRSGPQAVTAGVAADQARPSSIINSSTRLTAAQCASPARDVNRNIRKPELLKNKPESTAPKSSAALRETIAKAKAAKKEIAHKKGVHSFRSQSDVASENELDLTMREPVTAFGPKTIRNRIQTAITSGTLNIAAMGLKSLPSEILTMYDFDEGSNINWSEAVDLVKFNAADNDLEEAPDAFFPDWSTEELQDDDEKSNQFRGLQVLEFRGNRLSTLPHGLRRLEELRILNLTNNKLGNGALEIISHLHQLRELRLANNNISGIMPDTLAGLSLLEILDLHSNLLTGLSGSMGSLKSLQKLDVSHNKIQRLPTVEIETMTLAELNVSRNSLSGCLFPNAYFNSSLRVLNVASNKLTSLCDDQFGLLVLESLVCNDNQLTTLPSMSQLKSLMVLTASNNRIEHLPEDFVSSRILRNVDVSANNIKALDPRIAQMEDLTTLYLSGNPLRDRRYLNLTTDQLKAEMAKRLDLDVTDGGHALRIGEPASSNSAAGLMSTKQSRYTSENAMLNLSSQNLVAIDLTAIDLEEKIRAIRLSDNSLSGFPLELLDHNMVKGSLRSLDLSHNRSLHPTSYLSADLELPLLKSLDLSSSGVTTIDALIAHLHAPALEELNISCLRLDGPIPKLRSTFPLLKTLSAADNCFTGVDVEAIHGLEVVDVRNNNISYLPPKIGELGNQDMTKTSAGRLRAFECSGNKFRVPRLAVLERGTEAILRDLRRMIPADQVGEDWQDVS